MREPALDDRWNPTDRYEWETTGEEQILRVLFPRQPIDQNHLQELSLGRVVPASAKRRADPAPNCGICRMEKLGATSQGHGRMLIHEVWKRSRKERDIVGIEESRQLLTEGLEGRSADDHVIVAMATEQPRRLSHGVDSKVVVGLIDELDEVNSRVGVVAIER